MIQAANIEFNKEINRINRLKTKAELKEKNMLDKIKCWWCGNYIESKTKVCWHCVMNKPWRWYVR